MSPTAILLPGRGKRAVPVRDHVVHETRPFDLIAERHTPARPDLSHAVDGTVDGHRVVSGFVRQAVCQVADGRLVTVAGRTVSEQDERRTLGSLRWRPQGAGNRPLDRFASNSELAYRPPGRVVGIPPAEGLLTRPSGERIRAGAHERRDAFRMVVVLLVGVEVLVAEDLVEFRELLEQFRGDLVVVPRVDRPHVHAHEYLDERDPQARIGARCGAVPRRAMPNRQ